MTVGGVLNHLRRVEHSWIETKSVDGPDLGPWTEESPDQVFLDGAVTPLDELLREWAQQTRAPTPSSPGSTSTTGPPSR